MRSLILENFEAHYVISECPLIGLLDFFVTLMGDVFY